MKHQYLDRSSTAAIKGIGLILMFVHHFFTFPGWLAEGIEYSWIESFASLYCGPTKICVAVFAFLTGYFYAFARKKTLTYSLRKISDVLVSYWLVYLLLLLLAITMGCYDVSMRGILWEAFGLSTPVMSFCWYIYFYCAVMLCLPLLSKPACSLAGDILMLLVVPGIFLEYLQNQNLGGLGYSAVYNIHCWLPCVFSGYLFAKYDVFGKVLDPRTEGLRGWKRLGIFVLITWTGFRGRYFVQDVQLGYLTILGGRYPLALPMDILYAPLLVYGLGNLLQYGRGKLPVTLLEKIGEKSMLMWFFHCVFFNVCKEYTQPILYFPQNPILVLLNGLLICYVLAGLVNPVLKRLLKIKHWILDRIFFWER